MLVSCTVHLEQKTLAARGRLFGKGSIGAGGRSGNWTISRVHLKLPRIQHVNSYSGPPCCLAARVPNVRNSEP